MQFLNKKNSHERMIDVDSIKLRGNETEDIRLNPSDDIIDEYENIISEENENNLLNASQFPPIIISEEENQYKLIDGQYRLKAYKKIGIKKIKCIVIKTTQEKALLLSIEANTTHGVPLSNNEKWACVRRVLKTKWSLSQSDRAIGRLCGVSNHLVKIVKYAESDKNKDKAKNCNEQKQGNTRPNDGVTPLTIDDFKVLCSEHGNYFSQIINNYIHFKSKQVVIKIPAVNEPIEKLIQWINQNSREV